MPADRDGRAGAGGQGLVSNGTDTSVKLPDDLLAGLNSITVATDVLIDPAQPTPYFIYVLGNTSGGNGNGYLFSTGDGYRTSIATGDWSTERTTAPSPARNLPQHHPGPARRRGHHLQPAGSLAVRG